MTSTPEPNLHLLPAAQRRPTRRGEKAATSTFKKGIVRFVCPGGYTVVGGLESFGDTVPNVPHNLEMSHLSISVSKVEMNGRPAALH